MSNLDRLKVLKSHLQSRRLSQQALADLIEYSLVHVSRNLNGRTPLTKNFVRKVFGTLARRNALDEIKLEQNRKDLQMLSTLFEEYLN